MFLIRFDNKKNNKNNNGGKVSKGGGSNVSNNGNKFDADSKCKKYSKVYL